MIENAQHRRGSRPSRPIPPFQPARPQRDHCGTLTQSLARQALASKLSEHQHMEDLCIHFQIIPR